MLFVRCLTEYAFFLDFKVGVNLLVVAHDVHLVLSSRHVDNTRECHILHIEISILVSFELFRLLLS